MKKTEYISFRTDQETKRQLSELAAGRKWSVSLLVEDIVQHWLEAQKKESEEQSKRS